MLLISCFSFAQSKSNFLSFSSMKKSFNNTLYYCDRDDDYYINDTLYLNSSTSFFTCQKYISWNFLSKKKVGISSMRYIEGTHGVVEGRPLEQNKIFKYRIKKFENETYVLFYQKRKLVEKFKIIDIQSSGIIELFLVRVNN